MFPRITLTVSFSHAALWWKPASGRLVHALQERPPVGDASPTLQHISGRRVRDLQRRPVSHHRAPPNRGGLNIQFKPFQCLFAQTFKVTVVSFLLKSGFWKALKGIQSCITSNSLINWSVWTGCLLDLDLDRGEWVVWLYVEPFTLHLNRGMDE